MNHLSSLAQMPLKRSPLYTTPAFPAGNGPDFVNAAVAFETPAEAGDLLQQLHQIEADANRTRIKRWGPRSLDLDLIGLGDLICPDAQTHQHWRDLPFDQQTQAAPDQLILPHPRVQDRSFALVPLADVAPDWPHPVIGQTIRQMLLARPVAERDTVVQL